MRSYDISLGSFKGRRLEDTKEYHTRHRRIVMTLCVNTSERNSVLHQWSREFAVQTVIAFFKILTLPKPGPAHPTLSLLLIRELSRAGPYSDSRNWMSSR
jgi:hypothetical protein